MAVWLQVKVHMCADLACCGPICDDSADDAAYVAIVTLYK